MKVVSLLSLVAASLAQNLNFTTGCKPSDSYTVNQFDVGPNPVTKGTPFNVHLNGTLLQEITSGSYIKIEVKLGVINVYSQTIDLCKQEADAGHPCPIAPGPLDLSNGQALPSSAPSGVYNLKLSWLNADNSTITCAQGNIKIV
ncbi:Phosphatidylglycerol/phosphatidylinositol transfer protein [Kappamyces sp. JEL0829]|nr:Phosphatidylglycerol/phosphatidylinositol transfer protein [Kappamyces sp. JEL0829]KAJ3363629.1 Phosphatidylglycerol/phosphatidylinositol transfer protein [Kappamyces sp. JEL0680]